MEPTNDNTLFDRIQTVCDRAAERLAIKLYSNHGKRELYKTIGGHTP